MIKCEVIKEFTLKKFDELKNIKRRSIDIKGKLYVGDTFECDKEMADYLMGNNKNRQVVVKVLEVIPEVEATIEYSTEEKEPTVEVNIKKEFEEKYVKEALKKNTKKKKTSEK